MTVARRPATAAKGLLFALMLAGCATPMAQAPEPTPAPAAEEETQWPEQSIPASLTLA